MVTELQARNELNMDQGRYLKIEEKQNCHSCKWHSALTCCIILQSIIKIFQMTTDTGQKWTKYTDQGDIIRKWRHKQLLFLPATHHTDLGPVVQN